MTHKYYAELYDLTDDSNMFKYRRESWFCREFAQRDINSLVTRPESAQRSLRLRVGGLNMRRRNDDEIVGMAKYAKLLLPDNTISADSTSIWIDILKNEVGYPIYPPREIYSLLHFYIKYLSIQMKDRVDFERVCKAMIRIKLPIFKEIPDQQLGTALYFFSYVKSPNEMLKFYSILGRGNGPGTAMKQLAHLEDETVDIPTEAGEFYYTMLDKWCGTFKKELLSTLNKQVVPYARFWYLPIIVQDVYERIYDGDGKFDNREYSEDEW